MEREELLALMVKELPRLLQEHTEARYQLLGILTEVFARRDEFQAKGTLSCCAYPLAP